MSDNKPTVVLAGREYKATKLPNGELGLDYGTLCAIAGTDLTALTKFRAQHQPIDSQARQARLVIPQEVTNDLKAIGLKLAIQFISEQAGKGNEKSLALIASVLGAVL